jgi:hypothetical protein
MSGSTDRLSKVHPAGEDSEAKIKPVDDALNRSDADAAPHLWLIDSIKEASLNTRRLFIIYLTYLFYSAVAIAGTSDKQIVFNEKVRLPVIDVLVPIDQFFSPELSPQSFVLFISRSISSACENSRKN